MIPDLDRLIEREISSPVLTIEEAREQCRIVGDSEDASLETCMAAAEAFLSNRYGLEFGKARRLAKWVVGITGVERLYLPVGPAISVENVQINGAAGIPKLEAGSVCAFLDFGAELPQYSRISAEYTCGFSGDVPDDIKQAVRLLTAFYFDNRDAAQGSQAYSMPFSVDALMAPWKKAFLA